MTITTRPRIEPLEPPYPPDVGVALAKWMPPGTAGPPLALFRTLARHPMLLERMRPLGSGLLGRGILPIRVRELLILRTSARCGARYEWGVHVAAFAAAAGLDDVTVHATAIRSPEDASGEGDDDALAMRVADELHDTGRLSEPLFSAVVARYGEPAVLEMAAVAGFYHLIAFILGTAQVAPEPWAAPFPDPR